MTANSRMNVCRKLVIRLKVKDKDAAWSLATAIKEIITTHTLTVVGVTPRVSPESEEAMKILMQMAAKAYSFLREHGISGDKVKMDYKKKKSAVSVFKVVQGARNQKLLTWSASAGWGVIVTTWNTFTVGLSESDVISGLNKA